MSDAWRIDSLDARAGLAFASWREADLSGGAPRLDRDAVFLSPPAFSPEVLGSRAIGFGAARGQAQLGVFLDGEELAFATLEALTEFVRRLYMGSGGGDAGGGGGRPGPPEPEGGGPPEDLTWRSREGTGAALAVLKVAAAAAGLAEGLKYVGGEPVQAAALYTARTVAGAPVGDGLAIANGAAELVTEFLSRYPVRDQAEEVDRWLASAQRLGVAVTGLGLWPAILEGPFAPALQDLRIRIARTLRLPSDWAASHYLLPALFGGLPSAWPWPRRLRMDRRPLIADYERIVLAAARFRAPSCDPLDDLEVWPLPGDIAKLVGSAQPAVTAFHLVSTISATPEKLSEGQNIHVRAAEILLFCVAHVLAEADPPLGGSWLRRPHRTSAAEMANRSLEWMSTQWPTFVFPRQVEALIGEASALTET